MNFVEANIAEIVLQNTLQGLIGFDKNLNCTYWNRAMESITGFSRDEVLGKNIKYFLTYLEKTGEIHFYERTLHGESHFLENQLFYIPDKGRHGFYTTSYKPLFGEAKEVIGGLVMVQETSKFISALQALDNAEEKYNCMVNKSPLPIVVFSEKEILFANPKTLELLDLEDNIEIIGKSPLQFVVEEERQKATENIKGILNHTIQHPIEHTILKKDGSQIIAEFTCIATVYSGKPAIQVIFRDITYYKKAFQDLLSHKQMLHETQSMAKMGSYQISLKGDFNFWTDGIYRILEIQRDNLSPGLENYLSYTSKPVQEDLLNLVRDLKSGKLSEASYIHKIQIPGGKEKFIKVIGKPKPNEQGEVDSIIGTIQDISEIRKVEDELHRANQILNLQFENSPLATIQLDSNLYLTSWSKQAVKIFGWTAEEVVGKKITSWEFINEEIRDSIFKMDTSGQANFFNMKKSDIKLSTKNNTTVYCDLFMSGISSEDGKVHSFLILLNDVTSRQISEQSRLDGQLEERKRIAREIHDGIGQMLIAIKYKMASLEEFIPEQFQYKLHTLEGMLEQTLEEVRSVSKNLGPRSVATMGLEVSLRQMCDQIKKMTAIDFSFRYIGSGQEVNNKIVNALYRIAQETTNNIIKHAMATVACIQVFQGRNFIELKVEDNGHGISGTEHGKGMGMKNMEERARLLGGRFQVHSEPGVGTSIIVNIPLEQVQN